MNMNMKMLVTSDWHADAVTNGIERYNEIESIALEMVKTAIEERVSVFVFAGDLCNPGLGGRTIMAISLASKVANMLDDVGIRSIWLAGNHDVVDVDYPLSSLMPLCTQGNSNINVAQVPMVVELAHVPFRFLCLPYVSKYLGARMYEHHNYVEALTAGFSAHDWKYTIVVSHMTALDVTGLEVGTESNEFRYGKSYKLNLPSYLDRGVRLVIQGHFHKHQRHGGLFVPGSLVRLGFGEEKHHPHYHILSI
jgi:DNA repair exonuclease SbcCD nuclease subunit